MKLGTRACAVVLAISSAVSLAGIAQDAPDSRAETRPESQAVVKPEPSPDELPDLIATAQGSDLAARRAAFVRIGEIVDWIDWRFRTSRLSSAASVRQRTGRRGGRYVR